MTDSAKRGLVAAAYFLWLVAFGVGIVRLRASYLQSSNALKQTQALTTQLLDTSVAIDEASRHAQAGSREMEFLRSLVSLLPESKSFARTQRAMLDEIEVLRVKVSRKVKNDLHILVDTRANKLYVKQGLLLLWEADCSVGRGGILQDKVTGRRWEFVTPRGVFDVREKIENPLWIKPDWAFVEENKPVPPPGDVSRQAAGELGGYVLNLGDGYLIHGTKDEASLGRGVSHGCVRLGAEDLKRVHEVAPRGTRVYIY